MASFRKKGKNWYWRSTEAAGARREHKGTPDRRVTEQLAAAHEAQQARIKAGLIDAQDARQIANEARPLADHLADWKAHLLATGCTDQHARECFNRVTRLAELADATRLSDLTPARFQAAAARLRDAGLSLRTVHHHVRQAKTFSRWLWRDSRTRDDRLAHLAPPAHPETDRRRERRALAAAECLALIVAAESGPVVYRTPGPIGPCSTGWPWRPAIRASEWLSLTPAVVRPRRRPARRRRRGPPLEAPHARPPADPARVGRPVPHLARTKGPPHARLSTVTSTTRPS